MKKILLCIIALFVCFSLFGCDNKKAGIVYNTELAKNAYVRQAEEARQSESKQAEAVRQAELKKEKEARQAEEAKQAEEDRQAEEARQAKNIGKIPGTGWAANTYSRDQARAEMKEIIAEGLTGNDYSARSGRYIGRYLLDESYLNGDYSPENQERAFDQYCLDKYGKAGLDGAYEHFLIYGTIIP